MRQSVNLLLLLYLIPSAFSQPQPVWTDNCLAVTSTNTCSQCVDGFFFQYFLCLPCAPLCKCTNQYDYCESCMTVKYPGKSYEMQPFQKQDQGRCYLCDSFINNCLECSSTTTCTKCYGGFYPVTSGQCSAIQCQQNCQICSSNSLCDLCLPGYNLDAKSKICGLGQCTPNCLTCASSSTCKTCLDQYFLTQGQCSACITNCIQCNNAITCNSCAPGYYVDAGACVSTTISNCLLYAGGPAAPTACQVCQPGYYVLYGACNPCVGCELCSLEFLCQSKCLSSATPFNYACWVQTNLWERRIVVVFPLLLLFLALF